MTSTLQTGEPDSEKASEGPKVMQIIKGEPG